MVELNAQPAALLSHPVGLFGAKSEYSLVQIWYDKPWQLFFPVYANGIVHLYVSNIGTERILFVSRGDGFLKRGILEKKVTHAGTGTFPRLCITFLYSILQSSVKYLCYIQVLFIYFF